MTEDRLCPPLVERPRAYMGKLTSAHESLRNKKHGEAFSTATYV